MVSFPMRESNEETRTKSQWRMVLHGLFGASRVEETTSSDYSDAKK